MNDIQECIARNQKISIKNIELWLKKNSGYNYNEYLLICWQKSYLTEKDIDYLLENHEELREAIYEEVPLSSKKIGELIDRGIISYNLYQNNNINNEQKKKMIKNMYRKYPDILQRVHGILENKFEYMVNVEFEYSDYYTSGDFLDTAFSGKNISQKDEEDIKGYIMDNIYDFIEEIYRVYDNEQYHDDMKDFIDNENENIRLALQIITCENNGLDADIEIAESNYFEDTFPVNLHGSVEKVLEKYIKKYYNQ